MSWIVSFIFSVGGLVVSVLISVACVNARPQSRRARRSLLAVTIVYTVATIYATSYAVQRLYVIGFRPLTVADVPARPTAVAILGSGAFTIRDWGENEYSIADGIGVGRVLEAVRVYKMVSPDWVISSGATLKSTGAAQPTGVTMRNLLIQLGVPADRIVTDTTARDTHDESLVAASLVQKLKFEQLVLVTSEVHMRRALGVFRAAGMRPIPAIVREPFPARSLRDWMLPSEEGLWGAGLLAHELLGVGYYAARGWYQF